MIRRLLLGDTAITVVAVAAAALVFVALAHAGGGRGNPIIAGVAVWGGIVSAYAWIIERLT